MTPRDDKPEAAQPVEAAGPWQRLKRWFAGHHLRLMTIPDTPHSIALGCAIGIFFGFTPLLSLKTLLSIAVAWAFKSNKIAAAISVTLHDVILPVMPAIYLWEYKFGILALHGYLPRGMGFRHVGLWEYVKWTTFFEVGLPILVGSLFFAFPSAAVVYFVVRSLLAKARRA
jgi:uncharacterized protein